MSGSTIVVFVIPGGDGWRRLPPVWTTVTIGYVVSVLYLTILWRVGGRTVGFHVMGLRLVSMRGTNGLFRCCWCGAAFCGLFPIGLFWVVVSGGNRALWDVLLRTSVCTTGSVRTPGSREATAPLRAGMIEPVPPSCADRANRPTSG